MELSDSSQQGGYLAAKHDNEKKGPLTFTMTSGFADEVIVKNSLGRHLDAETFQAQIDSGAVQFDHLTANSRIYADTPATIESMETEVARTVNMLNAARSATPHIRYFHTGTYRTRILYLACRLQTQNKTLSRLINEDIYTLIDEKWDIKWSYPNLSNGNLLIAKAIVKRLNAQVTALVLQRQALHRRAA